MAQSLPRRESSAGFLPMKGHIESYVPRNEPFPHTPGRHHRAVEPRNFAYSNINSRQHSCRSPGLCSVRPSVVGPLQKERIIESPICGLRDSTLSWMGLGNLGAEL